MAFENNRTLIILPHMEGHRSLGNPEMNEMRFSYLKQLAFPWSSLLNRKPAVMVSFHDYDMHHTRMWEYDEMIKVEDREGGDVKMLQYHAEAKPSIQDIIDRVESEGMEVIKNTRETPIIFGGTNTIGCVTISKPYSALKWAKQGWYVEILLPMCADYQTKGNTNTEIYMETYAQLYNEIKMAGVIEYVDIKTTIESQYQDHWKNIFDKENNE